MPCMTGGAAPDGSSTFLCYSGYPLSALRERTAAAEETRPLIPEPTSTRYH